MNRLGRATLMIVLGVFVVRLILSDGYAAFVQTRMKLPLILAAVMLLLFGAIEAVIAWRAEGDDPDASKRSISPTVGWLLAAPLLVLTAVAPTALGAAAAQRADPLTPTELDPPDSGIEPIDDSNGPVEMRVYEFLSRALWDETGGLADKQIVLEGIVVNDADIDDGFLLTRFAVSCCAADGLPLQVAVRGVDRPYDNDTWVRTTVVWRPPPAGADPYAPDSQLVQADLLALELVDDPPSDPYETPF